MMITGSQIDAIRIFDDDSNDDANADDKEMGENRWEKKMSSEDRT